MKFLLDAHLPPSLKQVFIAHGYECMHTSDLDSKNETSDQVINTLSIKEKRILVTKVVDFLNSFLLIKQPWKLILVKLGNTSRKDLNHYFSIHFAEIISRISQEDMVALKNKLAELQQLRPDLPLPKFNQIRVANSKKIDATFNTALSLLLSPYLFP